MTNAQPDLLPVYRIISDQMGRSQALAVWRDALPHYRSMPWGDEGALFVDVAACLIETVILCGGRIESVAIERSSDTLADGSDQLCLLYTSRGRWAVEAEGRSFECGDGRILCLESSRPFRVTTPGCSYVFLMVPRERFTGTMSALPALHGRTLNSVGGRVLAAHLEALFASIEDLPRREAEAVIGSTLGLMSAAFDRLDEGAVLPGAKKEPGRGLRRAVERHIERNLSDPDLSPATIARDLDLQRTSLYRAFSEVGGVANHIRTRRLDTACTLLLHPEEHRGIGEIAATLGFPSTATFSKSFHRRFGCFPREARRRGSVPSSRTRGIFETWRQAAEGTSGEPGGSASDGGGLPG